FTARKFHYRLEIGTLLELARNGNHLERFEEILFYAKFLTHAESILRRVGLDDETTKHLAAEFLEKSKKTIALLTDLLAAGSPEQKLHFDEQFFSLAGRSMNNLMGMLDELRWIKNYLIDSRQPMGFA